MSLIDKKLAEEVLDWCVSVLGDYVVVDDATREHPGQRASVMRLRSALGDFILKIHLDPRHWDSEVHGYEHWAPAFGPYAPKLIAVRDVEPRAVLISALPGAVLEDAALPIKQESAVWRAAGRALAALHDLPPGEFFGQCRRDGTSFGPVVKDAIDYVTLGFRDWQERGERGGYLSTNELSIVRMALDQVDVFNGEHPVACHRDYCPANWLVSAEGRWVGVIDFEFAYWDVRAADLTRYPNWDWIRRPEFAQAFFDGYGRSFTPAEERQHWIAHVQYALGAVVWGMENAYFVYAQEGRQALEYLGKQV
jgi:aminoglycoside phosphotransferase (APT) family kinase protein